MFVQHYYRLYAPIRRTFTTRSAVLNHFLEQDLVDHNFVFPEASAQQFKRTRQLLMYVETGLTTITKSANVILTLVTLTVENVHLVSKV